MCGFERGVAGIFRRAVMFGAMQPAPQLAMQVGIFKQVFRVDIAAADQLPIQSRQPLRVIGDSAVEFM
jgi:hypothetical protein